MDNNKNLETSSKALDQIMRYLNRGPVLFLIGFFIVTNLVAIIFLVKVLIDSRNREVQLKDDQIEYSREILDKMLDNKLRPIEEKVDERVNRIDSTISGLDSLTYKLK